MNRRRMTVLAIVAASILVTVVLALAGAGREATALAAAPRQIITETVMLAPSQDNTLYQSELGTVSNGKGAYLFAGNTNNGLARRAVVAFDVAGALPAGATVLSAEVSLQVSRLQPGADESAIGLHALARDWGEGASDAAGEEGAGALAQTGDATWLHTFYDTATWTQPGGDFGPALATTTVAGTGRYGWASAALTVDVQRALDSPGGFFGWALLGDESASGTARRLNSREHGTVETRPRLTITYLIEAPPESRTYVPSIMR